MGTGQRISGTELRAGVRPIPRGHGDIRGGGKTASKTRLLRLVILLLSTGAMLLGCMDESVVFYVKGEDSKKRNRLL